MYSILYKCTLLYEHVHIQMLNLECTSSCTSVHYCMYMPMFICACTNVQYCMYMYNCTFQNVHLHVQLYHFVCTFTCHHMTSSLSAVVCFYHCSIYICSRYFTFQCIFHRGYSVSKGFSKKKLSQIYRPCLRTNYFDDVKFTDLVQELYLFYSYDVKFTNLV